jgi:hypothetical protein
MAMRAAWRNKACSGGYNGVAGAAKCGWRSGNGWRRRTGWPGWLAWPSAHAVRLFMWLAMASAQQWRSAPYGGSVDNVGASAQLKALCLAGLPARLVEKMIAGIGLLA